MDSVPLSHGPRKMPSPSFRGPVLLLGIAAAILGMAFIVPPFIVFPLLYDVRPLVLPVSAQPGEVRSPPFRIYREEPYTVELEVDRVMPTDRLGCLLGESAPGRDCGAVKPVVDVQWSLLRAGAVVASGTSSQNYGVDATGKTERKILGSIQAKPGRGYTLDLHVLSSLGDLRAAHPRVVVEESSAATEADAALTGLVALAAFPVGCAGLVWLAYVGYWHLRSKRRPRMAEEMT